MSPNKKKDVALACYALTSSIFAMMHNPRYRGPNFKWEGFANMMEEKCEAEIFIYVNRGKYKVDDIRSYAKECGREIAEGLVSKMSK